MRHVRPLASAMLRHSRSWVGSPALVLLVRASVWLPVPSRLREAILRRWGIVNHGYKIPRRVVFTNRFVSFEPGSSVSKHCRFEGLAPITVTSGVHLRGPLVLTSVPVGGNSPTIDIDVPLRIGSSDIAPVIGRIVRPDHPALLGSAE